MTLTNHTRRIEELAGVVTILCDSKKYEEAQCALDDIETKVHKLRLYVEHLQWITNPNRRSAGEAKSSTSESPVRR